MLGGILQKIDKSGLPFRPITDNEVFRLRRTQDAGKKVKADSYSEKDLINRSRDQVL